MFKTVIKNNKFLLSNETKISLSLIKLLRENQILPSDKFSNNVEIGNEESSLQEPELAFDIFKYLESCNDENIFEEIFKIFDIENQASVLEILKSNDVDNYVNPNFTQSDNKKPKRNKVMLKLPIKLSSDSQSSSKERKPTNEADKGTAYLVANTIHYYFDKYIGSGKKVCLGYYVYCGDRLDAAVKIVDLKDGSSVKEKEIKVWLQVMKDRTGGSNYIAPLLEMAKEEEYEKLYVATLLADRNLKDEITRLNPFRDRVKILGYLRNVSEALEWLHAQNILHRNIKPSKVLIYERKTETAAKLTDFGVSRPISKPDGSLSAGRGTQEWMSPEALVAMEEGQKFLNTKMVDIFSLGLLYYFALTGGEHPFYDGSSEKIHVNIRKLDGPVNTFENYAGLACQENLVRWMLQKKPQDRPTVKQVLKHPLFWNEEKCLKFVGDLVGKCHTRVAPPDTPWNKIRTSIDDAYKKYYRHIHTKEFNWKDRVDSRLLEHQSGGQGSGKELEKFRKNGDSLLSLAELIRDKDQHGDEMTPDLMKLFSENDANVCISKTKYAKYFFSEFPDLIVILFCALSLISKSETYKGSMKKFYEDDLMPYSDLNHNNLVWSDKVVNKFLSFLEI